MEVLIRLTCQATADRRALSPRGGGRSRLVNKYRSVHFNRKLHLNLCNKHECAARRYSMSERSSGPSGPCRRGQQSKLSFIQLMHITSLILYPRAIHACSAITSGSPDCCGDRRAVADISLSFVT